MHQFTVPQFIDVEDKIIGPITVRQFIILIVGGLVIFLEFKLSDMVLFILLAAPTTAVFSTVAFLKVNGIPFHYFLLNIFETFKKPNLRVWQREIELKRTLEKSREKAAAPQVVASKKPLTASRLSDISLIIDTGGIYEGEERKISGFFNNNHD